MISCVLQYGSQKGIFAKRYVSIVKKWGWRLSKQHCLSSTVRATTSKMLRFVAIACLVLYVAADSDYSTYGGSDYYPKGVYKYGLGGGIGGGIGGISVGNGIGGGVSGISVGSGLGGISFGTGLGGGIFGGLNSGLLGIGGGSAASSAAAAGGAAAAAAAAAAGRNAAAAAAAAAGRNAAAAAAAAAGQNAAAAAAAASSSSFGPWIYNSFPYTSQYSYFPSVFPSYYPSVSYGFPSYYYGSYQPFGFGGSAAASAAAAAGLSAASARASAGSFGGLLTGGYGSSYPKKVY
uniref:Uncharacterized protein n=1 Tax=Magallana gigas TaxID=29159 RepID=A0A8W8HN14_MAGGI